MKRKKQIDNEYIICELATIEGDYWDCAGCGRHKVTWGVTCPNCGVTEPSGYLTSHDALQRIIEGMDVRTFAVYALHLNKICEASTLKATPAQKAEAVLKAHNKWERSLNTTTEEEQ